MASSNLPADADMTLYHYATTSAAIWAMIGIVLYKFFM